MNNKKVIYQVIYDEKILCNTTSLKKALVAQDKQLFSNIQLKIGNITIEYYMLGWTADEVAECLPYEDDAESSLWVALWQQVDNQYWYEALTADQLLALHSAYEKEMEIFNN